jgi:ribosomal protein S6--L-glutamate ligase
VKVCLLVDRLGHPVLETAVRVLLEQHAATVDVIEAGATQSPNDADAYLLKSRAEPALIAARQAELGGALVINSVAATASCLDRQLMAQRMWEADLPFPDTRSVPTLDHVAASWTGRAMPIMIKSRRSRRGDLVQLITSSAELDGLASDWGGESVVTQAVVPHDGWDHKLWSIGDHLYAARRRSTFGGRVRQPDTLMPLEQLPHGVEDVARAVGAAFGLELYGVDVLVTADGPVVVDVNPFPGFRCVPAGGEALAAHLIERMEAVKAAA